MDVRAKQRLCYLACPFNSNGLGGGFAPRHLNRWAFSRGSRKRTEFYKIMTRKTLLFLYCLITIVGTTILASAQKSSPAISVVGCYSDLREQNGNILGNGVIKITKENGKFVGTFAELSNELGLTYEEVTLKNVVINQTKRTITFNVTSNRYKYARTKRKITGNITKTGIQMNWGEGGGEYGTAKSFMKRDKNCY